MTNNIHEGHLDPTSEITLETVKSRAVKGVLALTGRTLILHIITFVAQGFLWAFLEPDQFGVFLLVSATINFLSYFADIGLGAALIQKRDAPEEVDYKTVFTVQEILVLGVTGVAFLISPIIAKTHSLSHEAVYLLYALTVSFFLASLKNIPSIILERKLEFGKFIVPQVLENLFYQVSVVFFAWKGFGVTSFTFAVLIRGVVGVISIYILQPWRPGIAFSRRSLRGLLKFGLPYQLNNFLATIKDDGMTIILGGILGTAGLGILGTAQKLSQYPLRFFMDNVIKVTFPAFSRMQDDKDSLAKSVTRSIFFICALVFPSMLGLALLFPLIISVIPRYSKWTPALLPLIFLSVNTFFAAATTQLTNFFAAIGRIKTVFKLMMMWTILTFVLLPLLSSRFGVSGAALGYGLVGSSSVVVFILARKIIKWQVFESIGKPFISTLAMGVFILLSEKFLFSHSSMIDLIANISLGTFFYGLCLYLLVGSKLTSDVKKTLSSIFSK